MNETIDKDIVIGSGPAATAATKALVSQGRRVMLLDVGEQIEPERIALRDRLGTLEPELWDVADVEMARAPSMEAEGEGIRPYGSDVLFRDPLGFTNSNPGAESIGFKPSFAKGGMSNGWGASVLPYRSEDLAAWPIGHDDLAPHYAALKDFVPIAGKEDALAPLFPMLQLDGDSALPSSSQATRLLGHLDRNKERLAANGVHYGRARHAVGEGCRKCGMCLFGCPYRLIYNASLVIENLSQRGQIDYRPGNYVLRFAEQSGHASVWARRLSDGMVVEHKAARVFVAAGVMSTTKIVLNSLDSREAVLMDDSQHFFLPMLQRWWPRPDPARESRHTLTQVFIEILDPAVSANAVHFQLYTHNEFYAKDMRQRFGALAGLMSPLIAHLSRRLIVAQGFLHSDDSAKIRLQLSEGGLDPQLRIEPVPHEATGPAVARAVKRLREAAPAAGLLPLTPLQRLGTIGSSYHCGGTFPMREHPRGLQTDRRGRLPGHRRVFLADSSVFPSIPATTISLSIMANAHRIATLAGDPG